ncbi:MAG TPA: hypothetical protein VGN23_04390 [Verrucomicrobiae bacterium]|jgi:hypothetical protein
MKNRSIGKKHAKTPAFVLRAERALRRVARNVRAENRALNLPIIGWENGKLAKKSA